MDVLIIDDDAEDTEIFCYALREVAPEINCTVINDPKLALSVLASNSIPPQYIFLDANMTYMNGRDCLKQLRKLRKLNNTRIIMYSGYLSEQQVEELKSLGAD